MVARISLALLCVVVAAFTLGTTHASTVASSPYSSNDFIPDVAATEFTQDDHAAIYGVTHQEWERVAEEKMREHGYHPRVPGHDNSNTVRAPIPVPEAQWMEQSLDHFDPQNGHTFQQRYYVNPAYFNASRPLVFVSIGGESAVSPTTILYSNIAWQAFHFRAMLVQLEHRFYGASVPNQDASTANLKYLTSQQALADLAAFRAHIISEYPELGDESQWIVVGGSYPGSLSAWARLKYPDLFLGSISSSAPIQAEMDFYQYNEIVARSLGQQCTSQLQSAIGAVTNLFNSASGQAQLVQDFSLCHPFAATIDMIQFMSILSNPIKTTVQYAWDYRPGVWNMSSICDIMEDDSQTPYQNLIDLQTAYRAYFNKTGCVSSSYSAAMLWYRSYITDSRSWLWQTCNELGYFQTGDANDQPFSHLMTNQWWRQQCEDVFRIVDMQPHVADTNQFYGGAQIDTSNTIFTNGDLDPWSTLGNTQQYPTGGNTQNVLMHGTSHCRDLNAPAKWDPQVILDIRKEQIEMIQMWIEEDLVVKEKMKKKHVEKKKETMVSSDVDAIPPPPPTPPETLLININVRKAGARGDGIHDDSIAIQNALNLATANISSYPAPTANIAATLYLPAGRYLLNSPLFYTQSNPGGQCFSNTTQYNLTILGEQMEDVVLIWNHTQDAIALNFAPIQVTCIDVGVVIRQLSFEFISPIYINETGFSPDYIPNAINALQVGWTLNISSIHIYSHDSYQGVPNGLIVGGGQTYMSDIIIEDIWFNGIVSSAGRAYVTNVTIVGVGSSYDYGGNLIVTPPACITVSLGGQAFLSAVNISACYYGIYADGTPEQEGNLNTYVDVSSCTISSTLSYGIWSSVGVDVSIENSLIDGGALNNPHPLNNSNTGIVSGSGTISGSSGSMSVYGSIIQNWGSCISVIPQSIYIYNNTFISCGVGINANWGPDSGSGPTIEFNNFTSGIPVWIWADYTFQNNTCENESQAMYLVCPQNETCYEGVNNGCN